MVAIIRPGFHIHKPEEKFPRDCKIAEIFYKIEEFNPQMKNSTRGKEVTWRRALMRSTERATAAAWLRQSLSLSGLICHPRAATSAAPPRPPSWILSEPSSFSLALPCDPAASTRCSWIQWDARDRPKTPARRCLAVANHIFKQTSDSWSSVVLLLVLLLRQPRHRQTTPLTLKTPPAAALDS